MKLLLSEVRVLLLASDEDSENKNRALEVPLVIINYYPGHNGDSSIGKTEKPFSRLGLIALKVSVPY